MARRAPLAARGGCAGRSSDRRERRRLRGEASFVGFEEDADAERAAAARTDEARGIEKVAEEELLLSALARPGAGRASI